MSKNKTVKYLMLYRLLIACIPTISVQSIIPRIGTMVSQNKWDYSIVDDDVIKKTLF